MSKDKGSRATGYPFSLGKKPYKRYPPKFDFGDFIIYGGWLFALIELVILLARG